MRMPNWSHEHPEYTRTEKKVLQLTPLARKPVEHGLLMLKPEAIMAIQKGFAGDLLGQIVRIARAADMITSDWIFLKLQLDELYLLYGREIEKGVMSPERLDSLTEWPTAHLILTGPHARMASTIIKGRVSCRGGTTCYVHLLPRSGGITIPVITHKCPAQEISVKEWTYSCGIRKELSDVGAITPQIAAGNDTTWNMIHSTSTNDTYTSEWVIRLNQLPDTRFMTFDNLPVIPDFRTV